MTRNDSVRAQRLHHQDADATVTDQHDVCEQSAVVMHSGGVSTQPAKTGGCTRMDAAGGATRKRVHQNGMRDETQDENRARGRAVDEIAARFEIGKEKEKLAIWQGPPPSPARRFQKNPGNSRAAASARRHAHCQETTRTGRRQPGVFVHQHSRIEQHMPMENEEQQKCEGIAQRQRFFGSAALSGIR